MEALENIQSYTALSYESNVNGLVNSLRPSDAYMRR